MRRQRPASDRQRLEIARLATACGVLPRPVDTRDEAKAEVRRLRALPLARPPEPPDDRPVS